MLNQGCIKECGSTIPKKQVFLFPPTLYLHAELFMKTTYKNSPARAYLASMAETANLSSKSEIQKPKRMEGGCLLYTMPNSGRQQHPPTPYYS